MQAHRSKPVAAFSLRALAARYRVAPRRPWRMRVRRRGLGFKSPQLHASTLVRLRFSAQESRSLIFVQQQSAAVASCVSSLVIGDSPLGLPVPRPSFSSSFDTTPRYMPLDDSESAGVLP